MRHTLVIEGPGSDEVGPELGAQIAGDFPVTMRRDGSRPPTPPDDRPAHPPPVRRRQSGLNLWCATDAWQREIRAALASHDLTHVQYVLLASVTWMDRSEPVTQRDLADHSGTDVMMTAQVVRALDRRGLVTREPDQCDRRAVVVSPTPEGSAVANRATTDVEAVDDAFFAALPVDLRDNVFTALRTLGARPV